MRSDMQAKLHKFQQVSKILQAICSIFFALIAFQFLGGAVMLLAARDGALSYFNVSFPIAGLALHLRLVLLALYAVTSAVQARGVYYVRRLVKGYSSGEIFTRESVGSLRQIGINYLLWGGVNVLWTFLPLAVAAQGPRAYTLNLDSVTMAAILLIVAWFMEMAVEMREENELTI